MARPHSFIVDPTLPKRVAELYVDGHSYNEMAAEFDVSYDTISRWIKDPRVQVFASRLSSERINRITRKIDNEIEGRLTFVDEMDIEQLLKIRKEFLDRAMKVDLSRLGTDSATVDETVKALDSDPDLASQLLELLNAEPAKKPT